MEGQSKKKKSQLKRFQKVLAKQCQNPFNQFVFMLAVMQFIKHSKFSGRAAAVYPLLWLSAKTVGILQLVRCTVQLSDFMWTVQWCCQQIQVTSQVVATRANVEEWRSCLDFGSKWHKTSLQGAYKLWQLSQLSVPPPLANQWSLHQSGPPLGVLDQSIADSSLNPQLLQLMKYDRKLTKVHERQQLVQIGKWKWEAADSQVVATAEQLYQKLQDTAVVTNNLDFSKFSEQLTKFTEHLKQAVDWNHSIFK